ncbi:BspA family leucine-rich repeat surface protein [Flavivirga eckloniae]|uniref:PKD domain-containing protein n=1 Tax=Flavivirga eckloniae TaxID=1803846 RepID=A0A2K9PT74_9FLAO|nr:BspA family leucine-rich repeat surface protein [Flavivirga eckloniae]AUP80266.1 hypothetical protein C1H87_16760 [Flavivirga eckloniae]
MIKKIPLLVLLLLCYTSLQAQFKTTWQTTTANEPITIPTSGTGYNYTVDWGDTTPPETGITGSATHTYVVAGTYTVTITGTFPRISFSNSTPENKLKIQSIDQWGSQVWSSMVGAFNGCTNLQGKATDAPNLSMVRNMNTMFENASSFNQNIGNWDVSNVESMHSLFKGASKFDGDITGWDVSNVTSMTSMFDGASDFNQNIGDWDVSKVTTMAFMFRGAEDFDGNIGNWSDKVASVQTMRGMFIRATNFNQDIGDWDVSSVKNMRFMFGFATTFNQDLDWNVAAVTDMSNMFYAAINFNGDIKNWIVLNVEHMDDMFYQAAKFNQDIGGWDVTNVTRMDHMFAGAISFNQNLERWNVVSLTNARGMFSNVKLSMENYEALLEGWSNRSLQRNVVFDGGLSTYCKKKEARKKLIDTFEWRIRDGDEDCSLFDAQFVTTWQTTIANDPITIPTTGPGTGYNYTVDWGDTTPEETNQTGNATHIYATAGTYTVTISGDFPRIDFSNSTPANRLKIQSIEQWGTEQWLSMEGAFQGCENLIGKATDAPDLSRVGMSMERMFDGASSFNQDIGDWDVSEVTSMEYMFRNARSFNGSIGAWEGDVRNVTTMEGMFDGATAFNQDIGNWRVSNVTTMKNMFRGATSFNQDIAPWESTVSRVLNMEGMFEGATNFNQNIGNWYVYNVTNMQYMFRNAASFNGNIERWGASVSSVTNMEGMFDGATSFNKDIGGWYVYNVTNMKHMFRGATDFNGNIARWGDSVSEVTKMEGMFNGAISFNQNIGGWDVSKVENMTNMFAGVKLSTENYDALLKGWSRRLIKSNVTFHGGDSMYCNGEDERDRLETNFSWVITDGGKNCSLSTQDITPDTIKIVPNPTIAHIKIDLDDVIEQVNIYNLQGAEVMSQKQMDNKTMNLSQLSAGTYILKLQTDTATIVRKVVKK